MAGHRGALAGSSNQVEFYPDRGYVLVVLGNGDTDATEVNRAACQECDYLVAGRD
jgi:hypothetical protein